MSQDPNSWIVIRYDGSDKQVVLYNSEKRSLQVKKWEGGLKRITSGENAQLASLPSSSNSRASSSTASSSTTEKALTSTLSRTFAASQICPLCHSTIDNNDAPEETTKEDPFPPFVDDNYFLLLANSLLALPKTSSQNFLGYDVKDNEKISRDQDSTSSHATSSGASEKHISHDAMIDGYYKRFFVERKRIGSGFRGQVFLCEHMIDGESLGTFAVKKIPVGDNHTWFVRMLREVHMLEKLHHPNIVDYKHAWLENHQVAIVGPKVPCLFILIDYANSGNLAQYMVVKKKDEWKKNLSQQERIKQRKEKIREEIRKRNIGSKDDTQGFGDDDSFREFTQAEIVSIMTDVLLGLDHLHRHNIVHRDLKPQNLLLHYYNENQKFPSVLVSDFGECEMMSSIGLRTRTGYTGTIEYMSPELLDQDERGTFYTNYDHKSDMWSVGLVLYLLLFKRLPWDSEDPQTVKENVLAFSPEDIAPLPDVHKVLIDLLKSLLNKTASLRPSCSDALNALKQIDTESASQQKRKQVNQQQLQIHRLAVLNKSLVPVKQSHRVEVEKEPFCDDSKTINKTNLETSKPNVETSIVADVISAAYIVTFCILKVYFFDFYFKHKLENQNFELFLALIFLEIYMLGRHGMTPLYFLLCQGGQFTLMYLFDYAMQQISKN